MNPKTIIMDKKYLYVSVTNKLLPVYFYYQHNLDPIQTFYWFAKVKGKPGITVSLAEKNVKKLIKEVTPLWDILYES